MYEVNTVEVVDQGSDNDVKLITDDIYSLEELRKWTFAYNEFSSVEESSMPDYYKGIFPHKCACGAEMVIERNKFTQLQCCNPLCWVKWAFKLHYFISYLGYKDFGKESCKTLIYATHDKFVYKSFLSVFLLSDQDLSTALGWAQYSVFKEIKESVMRDKFWFKDAIVALGIPGIGKNSKLFEYVGNPNALLGALLKSKSDELLSICRINDPMTQFGLLAAKMDVFLLVSKVMKNICSMPKGKIFVAITGSVAVNGRSYTRRDFIALCESIVNESGEAMYQLVETKAQSKLQYVIADTPSTHEKYMIGKRLGILITADEFYKVLTQGAGMKDKQTDDSEGEESPASDEMKQEFDAEDEQTTAV